MKVIKRAFFGTGLVSAALYGSMYYAFPEVRDNQTELFHAAQRSARFVWGAAQLAYLYKYVTFFIFMDNEVYRAHLRIMLCMRKAQRFCIIVLERMVDSV